MFIFAIVIGVYSYLIFLLGVSGLLYKNVVIWMTVGFWGIVLMLFIKKIRKIGVIRESWKIRENKLLLIFLACFFTQVIINLIGTLGPERGFDALWYHLTLPKVYLQNHSIFFIPGGLLYYSAMPKLAEMIYVAGLSFGNEIIPKLIHFSFGLLTCLALYKLQKKFFNSFISLLGVVIFYSNLVVAWESITAYVDLVRTFFELMALWAFVSWSETKQLKLLIISATMIGFAITAKLLAIGSLVIFVLLILGKIRGIRGIREVGVFTSIALIIPMPWFIFSYINTGNPVYPFFTNIYKIIPSQFSPIGFFRDVWVLFTRAADPISPVYIIFLPLIIWIFLRKKIKGIGEIGVIGVYSILAIAIWYFTPRTGGGRFILPYLPALSILCAACYSNVLKNIRIFNIYFSRFLVVIVIFVSLVSVGYRFAANAKYLPVIFGKETKVEFLSNHLNFAYGDFYDIDVYFRQHINFSDKVLLYGFHNLYYVDFPFIDSTWVKKEDKYNYVATQNADLPEQFKDWRLLYKNDKTMVKLYKR